MTRRILVLEWVCGGGVTDSALAAALRPEGRAMLRSIASDIGRLAETVAVCPIVDATDVADLDGQVQPVEVDLRGDVTRLHDVAVECDAALVIAPETDGILSHVGAYFHDSLPGVRWLGASMPMIEAFSSKGATRKHFAADMLPAIAGPDPSEWPEQVVIKPDMSCGSDGVLQVTASDGAGVQTTIGLENSIVEEFTEGTPSSFFVVPTHPSHGGQSLDVWPTCSQLVSRTDNQFHYTGGRISIPNGPLPFRSSQRRDEFHRDVARLWNDADNTPTSSMSLGFDCLVRSDDTTLLEVNPRLTTSYIGYRAATDDNLAMWLLGEANRDVRWNEGTWSWTADGHVRRENSSDAAR